jgi:hypothetical protein
MLIVRDLDLLAWSAVKYAGLRICGPTNDDSDGFDLFRSAGRNSAEPRIVIGGGPFSCTEFSSTNSGEGRENFPDLSTPFLFTTQIDRHVRRQSNTGQERRS